MINCAFNKFAVTCFVIFYTIADSTSVEKISV